MTVNSVIGLMFKEKNPDIIKHKLDNFKMEVKLTNNKEIKIGNHVSIVSKNINIKKPIKVLVEIVNYSHLENEPCIAKQGQIISEIFKIDICNNNKKAENGKIERIITFKIHCPNLNDYCYPMIYNSEKWIIAEDFEQENDCIKINEGDWNMICIVKEHPYDVIRVGRPGGLLYTKLDPLISLRIPKGLFKNEFDCKIQICDMPLNHVDPIKSFYDDQLSPYLNISQMTSIESLNQDDFSDDIEPFRRPITIKLRLPKWVIELLNEQSFDSKNIVKDQKKEKLGFYLLQKIDNTWNFLENSLKFTSNSVEFNIKNFGSFIFVNCRENREIRLCQNLNLLENLIQSKTGVILTFLWIKSSNWYLWLECVPVNLIEETRSKFEKMGFIYIEQTHKLISLDDNKRTSRNNRKFSQPEIVLQRKTFELIENIQFKLSLNGELEICNKTKQVNGNFTSSSNNINGDNIEEIQPDFDDFEKIGRKIKKTIENNEDEGILNITSDLSYHQNMPHSNSVIVPIAPLNRSFSQWETIVLNKLEKRSIYEAYKQPNNSTAWTAPENTNVQTDIEIKLIEPSSEESKKATRLNDKEKELNFYAELKLEAINFDSFLQISTLTFEFYISLDVMKNYFQIKTKEEKEIDEIELIKEQMEKEKEMRENEISLRNAQIEEKPKIIDFNHLTGLAKPRFGKKVIEKESKILSRKSFLALSSIIRQGLKLAVYLSIPDNAIAGIGFDALSQMNINGTNTTTYKVLLLWKKMILVNKTKENDYVEQLIYGLKSIGYERIAKLVYDCWIEKRDISVQDCQRYLLQRIL